MNRRQLLLLLASLAVVFLLTCAGAGLYVYQQLPGPAEPAALDARQAQVAEAMVAALQAKDFDRATRDFTPLMKEKLGPDVLTEVWTKIEGQLGALTEVGPSRGEKVDETPVVTIPLHFETMSLDARVTVDDDGHIAGLFFVPAQTVVNAESTAVFTETALTVGPLALPALLTLPTGVDQPPVAVLVHGSGPHNMDEKIGPNLPFRDIAHALAARGIAVLRYDKRTLVHPETFGPNGTVRDETEDDALAALAMLRERDDLDPTRTFLIGHSQGGWLAPRIASRDPKLSGIILLEANSRPLQDLIVEQVTYLANLDGTVDEAEAAQIAEFTAQTEALNQALAGGPDPAAPLLGVPMSWWRDVADYDPVATLAALPQPALVIQGSADYQVTASGDFARYQDAFSHEPRVTLRLFEGTDHLLAHVDGPSKPADYMVARDIAPEILTAMADWVLSVGRPASGQ